MKSLSLVLSLLLVISKSAQHVRYIKPGNDNSPLPECPGQPCLTLDQYTQQAETYFTTGATFLFLAGNHTPQTTVNLANISTLSIKGNSNVSIICRNIIIRCKNVSNLTIKGLVFHLHSSNKFFALEFTTSKGIHISKMAFKGSGKLNEAGTSAVYSQHSVISITSCLFDGNTGGHGGAIYARGSNITLTGNLFTRNKAGYGGAICAYNSSINLTNEFVYISNHSVGATAAELYSNMSTFENHFTMPGAALYLNNEADLNGGAIYLSDSNASLSGTVIIFRNNSAKHGIGGGIYIERRRITTAIYVVINTEHLYFIGNKAVGGGAIYAKGVTLTLGKTNHYFLNNSILAIHENSIDHIRSLNAPGGAISLVEGSLTIKGKGIFYYNQATYGGAIGILYSNAVLNGTVIEFKDNIASGGGGGIMSVRSNLSVKAEQLNFIGNTAHTRGGAINVDTINQQVEISNAVLNGTVIEFKDNIASGGGGGIMSVRSNLSVKAEQLNFIGNTAHTRGGAINVDTINQQVEISGNFINNTGKECGGAVFMRGKHNITFTDITATGNSESAFCIDTSKVTFTGYTRITNNTGKFGGGINSRDSFLLFTDNIEIQYNNALIGGAIYSLYGEVTFQNAHTGNSTDIAVFTHNTADRDGGALHATGTDITLKYPVHFVSNSARNGGAMYFKTGTTLTLEIKFGAVLNTSHNNASEFGGVLYYEDATAYSQCEFNSTPNDVRIKELPYCLLQLKQEVLIPITSYLNSAKKGEFIYGGLLDRCRMDQINGKNVRSYTAFDFMKEYSQYNNITNEITSPPYKLCFCESNQMYDCSEEKSLKVQRGQLMRISLIAFDQTRTAVSTLVTAITSPTARLELNQSPQDLYQNCSTLTYNLYSTVNHEQLILYPDGPCHDTGLARAVVNVTLLPCPDAFTQSTSGEQCVCEERLQVYGAECTINDKIYITRKAGTNFWLNSLSENGTYQGLVLYRMCPLDYCTNKTVNLTLDDPDIQCDHNRSGVLCGECNANYSLLLGSSKCRVCSNTYLALLFPFAAAGIALVISLSFLRLTVATGMINSIILYANIVQVNRNLFFTRNENNVLTVFIALLNLDLGFQTCFYNGMDAFAQTCLQFAFPLYIWILIGLIIITSRYSITVSRLIGHNPIAVLATLLLMSYTKILKIIIEVYSYVGLDYPDNNKVTVWKKDANVPYLQSKHLLLTVVTSLVLVFLLLPYTLLLLLGHKLYRFTGRKGLHWLIKMKPLLDSYYAPYKLHTRYWTGFLLLVRCVLYVVFSFNSLGAATKSLLAISMTFTAIIVIIVWLHVSIYEHFYVNTIEASIYLNLIILSTATLAGANTAALVYTLVGIVFATMIGIIVYHFHLLYTAKTSKWLKVRARITSLVASVKTLISNTTTAPPPENSSLHDPNKIISTTVIELREPLLEN